LLSLNCPSNIGVRTWDIACCITLSTTVGMPKRRSPPSGFGISTLNTGCGLYLRSRISRDISSLFLAKYPPNSSMVIPSTPAAPLFLITCLYASFRLFLSRISSSIVGLYMYVMSFLSRKVGIHFHASASGLLPSSNRDFYNDKIIQPFALSSFHQFSSLLRLLLTSRFPGIHHCTLLL